MKTSIAGYLTKENLDEIVNQTKERFNGRVNGFFNGESAKYKIEVDPHYSESLIYISSIFDEDWHNFVEKEEWSHFKELNKYPLSINALLLFPQSKLALIVDHFVFEEIPNGMKKLQELGYIPIDKKPNSRSWVKENKLNILSTLRSPESNVNVIDARAYQILDVLSENLSEKAESYTFGIYITKTRIKKHIEHEGPYDSHVIKEKIRVKKVKKLVEVPAYETGTLENLGKDLPLTRAIGITSKVKTSNGEKHIPMIDFKTGYIEDVEETVRMLNIPGMMVESGNSYHFYGFNLINEEEWKEQLEKIKNKPGVDTYWPDFQLKQGFSLLRLTPSRSKLFQPCFEKCYKA